MGGQRSGKRESGNGETGRKTIGDFRFEISKGREAATGGRHPGAAGRRCHRGSPMCRQVVFTVGLDESGPGS